MGPPVLVLMNLGTVSSWLKVISCLTKHVKPKRFPEGALFPCLFKSHGSVCSGPYTHTHPGRNDREQCSSTAKHTHTHTHTRRCTHTHRHTHTAHTRRRTHTQAHRHMCVCVLAVAHKRPRPLLQCVEIN